jgi:Family of unknown function (DUF5335)
MAVTREIPTTDWKTFLHTFGQLNAGRLARLERAAPPGEGGPLLAEHQALMDLELEPKGSEAPAIVLSLGQPGAPAPSFTHIINGPTRLYLEQDDGGRARALEIESQEEGKTLLLFELEEALPELGTR